MGTPRGEMLIVGPESAFQLKLISLNPQEFTGVGIEIPRSAGPLRQIETTPEFGFRPLSDFDLKKIIETLWNPEIVRPQIEKILKRAPLPHTQLNRIKGSPILSGPILTRPDLGTLGPDILKTQDLLDKLAWRKFRKQHQMRAGMFF